VADAGAGFGDPEQLSFIQMDRVSQNRSVGQQPWKQFLI
jgi:hypothetical protein